MSNSDPMGSGAAVALTVPAHHANFLRGTLDACKEGAEGDLAQAGDRHPRHKQLRREVDAYGRLLKALDTRVIVPDENEIRVLSDLAEQVDASNDYEQVVLEHRALCGMLGQIEEGK